VGLSYRSIRAAGSALLIAVAVGAGGMTGMASALGADPTMVAVAGTLVDGSGQPLGGIHLTIEEELPPDGGIAAFPVTTAGDGTFAADLYAWGSVDAPAAVTVETAADEQLTVESGSCSQTWGVLARDRRELALAEAAPEPLVVTATTTLLGEVCGTTGTPGGGNGSTGGAGGAQITPPPTDADLASSNASRDRLGPALTLGFVLGLALASAFLVVRPGTRRRGG
jgi:hypothetical protein